MVRSRFNAVKSDAFTSVAIQYSICTVTGPRSSERDGEHRLGPATRLTITKRLVDYWAEAECT